MLKKALLIILGTFLLAGCGYKMTLSGKDSAFTLYPVRIENLSKEITATSQFIDGIKYSLAVTNTLASKDKADYTAEFVLKELKTSGASASSASTTAIMNLTVNVAIFDKEKVIFNRNFNAVQSYDNTNSQSQTRANKELAMNKAIEKTMVDFRNAFQQKK
ncbi:MAG: hypothetical protein C0602_02125 [Denitrovibrio sp.]|nr:MAG: hypothetical protein C0602_02125 [Denitrovibrio sp.]